MLATATLEKPMKARRMTALALVPLDNDPTPEMLAKGDEFERIETEVAIGRVKAWKRTESTPFDRYANRRQLGPDTALMRAAAERYYENVRRAGFEPLPQSAGIMRVDNGAGSPEMAHAAKEAVFAADRAMGPTQAACVRAVVVEGWSADAWARKASKHPKCGIEFLKDGLWLLCRHWGLL